MQRKHLRNVLLASLLTLAATSVSQGARPVWSVKNADIMKDGQLFRIQGGSWFGLEGRHESPTDEKNPGGAPMELYMGHVWWDNTSTRTYESSAKDIAALGFNCIRMPVTPQTFDDKDPQGTDFLKNDTAVLIKGSFTALKKVLKVIDDAGMYVMLDIHSCSNWVGWRKGRLDARPPWVDANREGYKYTREDCSCSETGNPSTVKADRIRAYNKEKWLANLRTLAGLDKELGLKNGTIGIDIFNEPWDYSWEEWKTLIEEAYQAINSVNPNILVFAQGIGGSNGSQDGTPGDKKDTPFGTINVNWGENLYEAGTNPPNVPKEKLVYSPHTYGPSVCTQDHFADLVAQPQCKGLVEDKFGDAKCQIKYDTTILYKGWDEHFGYLRQKGYAIAPGEFGGNMDWPAKAEQRHQTRYSYLTNKKSDEQWQNHFVDYLISRGIANSFYWSINPESADTYGVFTMPYDPINNTGGWGTWSGTDSRKTALLKRLWAQPDQPVGVTIPMKLNDKSSFNCRVTNAGLVSYTLPAAGKVTASLYNVNGRLHGEIMNKNQNAGSHSFNFTAPSGSYILVLKAGEYSSKQMVSIAK
jgi:endoglucanase